MKILSILLLLLSILASASSFAQDVPAASERGGLGCESRTIVRDLPADEKSVHFPTIQQRSLDVNDLFCGEMNAALTTEIPPQVLRDYGDFLTDFEFELGSVTLNENVSLAMARMASVLGEMRRNRFLVPDFDVNETEIDDEFMVFFNASTSKSIGENVLAGEDIIISTDELAACNRHFATSDDDDPERVCFDVLSDLDLAIGNYKRGYQSFYMKNAEKRFSAITARWNRFFDNARAMTTLDLIVTSMLEKDHMRTGYIVGPPRKQYFVLHPNIVLQYHDGASKGEQFKPGISLEWFGVNWWESSPIGVPLGVSIMTVYADHPEVRTVGTGLMLFVDNSFSIGWTRNDGDNAFQISVDLLQFIQAKEKQFNSYKDRVMKLK